MRGRRSRRRGPHGARQAGARSTSSSPASTPAGTRSSRSASFRSKLAGSSLREATSGLVRPTRSMSDTSIMVHGIRAIDLADAPPLDEALAPLLTAITGRVLVVHTEAVERPFLVAHSRKQGLTLRGPVIDTEVLGRALAARARRSAAARLAARRARRSARAAGRPTACRGRRRAHHGAGVHRARIASRCRHAETVDSLADARHRLDSLRLFHAG